MPKTQRIDELWGTVSWQGSLLGMLATLLSAPAFARTPAPQPSANPPECTAPDGGTVAPPPANAKLPAVEPVICLDEFNREVPPLGPDDPELQRPLESMGEFEQILLSGQGATVAPGSDAELAQPLPPINQFDVREVELAEPAPNEAPVELRYWKSQSSFKGAADFW